MRDPERIDKVLAALGNYWKANPDLRLGQIVMNAYKVEWDERRKTPAYRRWLESDDDKTYDQLFNLEDDRLARGIEILKENL